MARRPASRTLPERSFTFDRRKADSCALDRGGSTSRRRRRSPRQLRTRLARMGPRHARRRYRYPGSDGPRFWRCRLPVSHRNQSAGSRCLGTSGRHPTRRSGRSAPRDHDLSTAGTGFRQIAFWRSRLWRSRWLRSGINRQRLSGKHRPIIASSIDHSVTDALHTVRAGNDGSISAWYLPTRRRALAPTRRKNLNQFSIPHTAPYQSSHRKSRACV